MTHAEWIDIALTQRYDGNARGRWFVCLFRVFLPLENIFQSYRDLTITSEGLQILTYVRHPQPLSSEGFCDTPTVTGAKPLWTSPRTCDTDTCCQAFGSEAITTCFNNLVCPGRGSNPDLTHVRQTLYINAMIVYSCHFHRTIVLTTFMWMCYT